MGFTAGFGLSAAKAFMAVVGLLILAQPGDAPRFVTLVLDKAGQLFLNDKPIAPAQLAEQLTATAKQNPETEIQLRADQAVPYGRVIEVMGVAHKAGLSRIGFVAEPSK